MKKTKVPFTRTDAEKYLAAGVPESLDKFLADLLETYDVDYASVCVMMGMFGTIAANKFNETPIGGITGSQANAVLWEFISAFLRVEGPMKLVRFENMLYPQYEGEFDKTITKNTFDYLEQAAKEKITAYPNASIEVRKHWESLINGNVPFGYKIKG